MLIEQGKVSTLRGKPWAAIDVASEARIEEIVLHIARWAGRVLGEKAFQLLFPVKRRDLSGVEMFTPHLYGRTADLQDFLVVKEVRGAWPVFDEETREVIPVEDKFVQEVMAKAREEADGWSAGIKRGSFVRVLFGNERMLCGEVEEMKGSLAVVVIRMRSRTVRLTIPSQALLNLSFVPKKEREYFYAD